jgi:hypothetical protein
MAGFAGMIAGLLASIAVMKTILQKKFERFRIAVIENDSLND